MERALTQAFVGIADEEYGESRVFIMPDGSTVTAVLPKGTVYTLEEATRDWMVMKTAR